MSNTPSGAPVRIGLLGCGRIGRMHAELVARRVEGLALGAVYDVATAAAESVADEPGGIVASDPLELINSDAVDAVAICSSTDTHVELLVAAAEAGKPVFLEKPVHLDLAEVDRGVAAVEQAGIPVQVGFNRRFDPSHRSVREQVMAGSVGEVQMVRITSRDPAPPPIEYIKVSGGIFLDMTIHDFDMARYVTGSEVLEVYAQGEVMVDPAIGEAGDLDTVVVMMRHENGAITTIDNSRQAVYGYDQRVEVFGSAG
ncbi:MAG: Gfo/Idh/MocA family oxidoreductase, partial [Ilumatobacter sp.]